MLLHLYEVSFMTWDNFLSSEYQRKKKHKQKNQNQNAATALSPKTRPTWNKVTGQQETSSGAASGLPLALGLSTFPGGFQKHQQHFRSKPTKAVQASPQLV